MSPPPILTPQAPGSLLLSDPKPPSHTHSHLRIRLHSQGKNLARFYVDAVRARKGLPVTRKLVVDAEKQRTRKR